MLLSLLPHFLQMFARIIDFSVSQISPINALLVTSFARIFIRRFLFQFSYNDMNMKNLVHNSLPNILPHFLFPNLSTICWNISFNVYSIIRITRFRLKFRPNLCPNMSSHFATSFWIFSKIIAKLFGLFCPVRAIPNRIPNFVCILPVFQL